MDALTDILRTVHFRGSVYCRSELSAPWGLAIPESKNAQFHVLRRGRCWLGLDVGSKEPPLLLEGGDMVLLPRGVPHFLVDAPKTRPRPLEELLACLPKHREGPLVHGGGGEPATLICGYFQFVRSSVHPLLAVLPPIVVVRGEGGRARSWLESTLDLIAEESISGRPGRETLVDRLSEAMFVYVVRSYLDGQEALSPSWLQGLKDPQMARALGLIHRQPNEPWTVGELAERVGMSRSAFSSRFHELVGEPPLQYLTRWRMQVAGELLYQTDATLARIAEQVGYQTGESFSKVFKRLWGVAPATFRRQGDTVGQIA